MIDIIETRKNYTKQVEFITALFEYYPQNGMIQTKTQCRGTEGMY